MLALLAQIASGHVDLADVLFFISFLLAAILVLLDLFGKGAPAVLLHAAVACLAAGFWVL